MDPKTILLVEDEIDTIEALKKFLERRGHHVLTARNGEEALEIVAERGCDIIVTDIIMPKMDGNQLIKKLKEDPLGQDIPILVITIRKNMRDYFDCVGIDGFLSKPCTPHEVLQTIEGIFDCQMNENEGKNSKRILVAGKDANCVEEIVDLLKTEGCHTDFILRAEQVVSKAVMFLPQTIILEAEMFGIASYEIVHIIRQMPQFKKIPIIIYSHPSYAKNNKDINHLKMMVAVERCLENGATEYIDCYAPKTFLDKMAKYLSFGSIVVIDDDRGAVALIKSKTEAEGYRVFSAENGAQGLDLIREIHPNLILLDVIMPDLNGFELLDIIKKDPEYNHTPVIMVTIKGEIDDVKKGLMLGADDYLVKPFYMGFLLKKIQALIAA